MKKQRLWIVVAALYAVLLGCAGTPEQNSQLAQVQSEYEAARSDPQVIRYATDELRAAEDSVREATAAWEDGARDEELNHLIYIATQKVAIAQAVASQKVSEEVVATAEQQRAQIRLQTREQQIQDAEQRAQELEQQLQELNAKQTNRGTVITLGDVLFAVGSAELSAAGVTNVQKLAEYLQENPERRAMIEGFTDSTGSETFNQQLSERRAESVKRVLIRAGIEESRLQTMGYGESFPVASNDNAGGRQLNRRVEVVISDESGQIRPR